jgi:hypothetical protein
MMRVIIEGQGGNNRVDSEGIGLLVGLRRSAVMLMESEKRLSLSWTDDPRRQLSKWPTSSPAGLGLSPPSNT